MWPRNDDMPAFDPLPAREKWRLTWCVGRGRAPSDAAMAPAAVELAEHFQQRHRKHPHLIRWAPPLVFALYTYGTLSQVLDGDTVLLALYVLVALICVAHVTFNPLLRPRSVARSLEASDHGARGQAAKSYEAAREGTPRRRADQA